MRALGTAVKTSLSAAGAPSMARTLPKARISRSVLFDVVPFMSARRGGEPRLNSAGQGGGGGVRQGVGLHLSAFGSRLKCVLL